MLLSMTGFGEARFQSEDLTLAVEVRAVNNRYLKVTIRAGEPYHQLEGDLEKVVRRTVRRGTVLVQVRSERQAGLGDYRLNKVALRSYLEQAQQVGAELGLSPQEQAAVFGQVLALPGVAIDPASTAGTPANDWPILEQVLEEALVRLHEMRREEGRAMTAQLLQWADHIAAELEAICRRIPGIALGYRDRLRERVQALLADAGVVIASNDLIKEVAVLAERSDVSEEVVRLASHLEQVREVLTRETEGPGRKLEFLVQEMGRETNTIGSKAGDVQVSRHVVEIKATLEKVRELIQNIE